MTCRACEPLLSALVDGDLSPAEAAEVGAHVASCAACARAKAEIERMVAAARALAEPEPPPALWTRIAANLPNPDEAPAPRRRWRWIALPSLGLAAAAAVVLLLVARRGGPSDAALLADAQSEFQQAEAHYARAAADLRVLVERERSGWPEERRRRHDEMLVHLDQQLDEARTQARARAADPDAEAQLLVAWRGEIAYLEQALLREEAQE